MHGIYHAVKVAAGTFSIQAALRREVYSIFLPVRMQWPS